MTILLIGMLVAATKLDGPYKEVSFDTEISPYSVIVGVNAPKTLLDIEPNDLN